MNPPRALIILVGTAAAVIVAAGIGAAAWLIGPAFLAWVIVVVIAPVGRRLRSTGLPAWVATAVLVVLVYGVVVVMAGVVVVSAARLATVLPQYAAEADGLRRGLGTLLATYGIGPDQVRAVVADLDIGKVAGYVGLLLAGLAGLATNLVFLLSLLLFIVAPAVHQHRDERRRRPAGRADHGPPAARGVRSSPSCSGAGCSGRWARCWRCR